MAHKSEKNQWLLAAKYLLCGALIGVGAILPGVSGGVLAVVFDVYRPMMEILTHPRRALPRYWRMFALIGAGAAAGFLGFARGLAAVYEYSDTVAVWLFIGLIAGTVPALMKEAGKEGRCCASYISMALCAAAMFSGLFYVRHVAHTVVEPNFWWYNFCGALIGMGVVIPGMTSSPVMMALGLYQPLLEGLSHMDVAVISACLPGMLVTIALLARLVTWMFQKHYPVAFHGIVGIVLASTLVIIPVSYGNFGEIVLSALCCGGGFALALLLARLGGPETQGA